METPQALFGQLRCDADFWSLRIVDEQAECYAVRKNVPQPPLMISDLGAMLTAYADGGRGDQRPVGARAADGAGPGDGLGARDRPALPDRFPRHGATGAAGRVRLPRALGTAPLAARVVRAPRRGIRGGRLRSADRRLGSD